MICGQRCAVESIVRYSLSALTEWESVIEDVNDMSAHVSVQMSVYVSLCVHGSCCRLNAVNAKIKKRCLRELRAANRSKIFDREVNNARIAAKMHVERIKRYVRARIPGYRVLVSVLVDCSQRAYVRVCTPLRF